MRRPEELSDPARILLWDLDGTLLDTQRDLATGINGLLGECGLAPLSTEVVSSHIGHGARNLVTRCLGERGRALHSPEETERALQLFERHYDRHLLDTTVAYGNLDRVVMTLRDRGRSMAIVTNKPEGFTRRILEGLGLLSCFRAIVGATGTLSDAPGKEDHPRFLRKPDPAPLLHALRLCAPDAIPLDAIMIGDSVVDVEAGRRAGISVCGVGWGLGPAGLVREANPDWWVETPEELEALLLGSSN